VLSFTPRPFYSQGKSLWYSSDRRLGGLQSSSGHSGGVEKIPSPRRQSNPRTRFGIKMFEKTSVSHILKINGKIVPVLN
jgi:hypothetical protein